MSYCGMQRCDYPLRVQFGKGLVVHAAREEKKHASTHYGRCLSDGTYEKTHIPEHMAVTLACSWRIKPTSDDLVPNNNIITCKNCAKKIGMAESKPNPKRYIIKRNDTGEYYKKTGWCPKWVEEPTEATLYKMKAIARNFTIKIRYSDMSGNEIRYHEYMKRKRAGENVIREEIKNPNYDVKTVTIIVDDC